MHAANIISNKQNYSKSLPHFHKAEEAKQQRDQ